MKQRIGVYSGSAAGWQKPQEIIKFMIEAKNYYANLTFNIFSYQLEIFESLISENVKSNNNLIKVKSLIPSNVLEQLSACDFGLMIRENNLVNKRFFPFKICRISCCRFTGDNFGRIIGDTEYFTKKISNGCNL